MRRLLTGPNQRHRDWCTCDAGSFLIRLSLALPKVAAGWLTEMGLEDTVTTCAGSLASGSLM